MDYVFTLDKHPVYNSLKHTIEIICKEHGGNLRFDFPVSGPRDIMFHTSRFHIYRSNIKFSKYNTYILNSPSICFDDWDALLQGIHSVVVEEYLPGNILKDSIIKGLLLPFRHLPFISLTKKTHNFLSGSKFNSYLIPPADKKHSGSKNRDIILYVGRMTEYKNPFFILELAKKLKNEYFVMVGKGNLSAKLKSAAKSMGNVEIIDFIEDKGRLYKDYYGKAKVLVHPPYHEPIGFVIIEALSASTPVLASVNAGASGFLPDNWAIKGHGAEDWVNAIKNLDDSSIKTAERTFEEENLNIESLYFKKVANDLNLLMQGKSLPTVTK